MSRFFLISPLFLVETWINTLVLISLHFNMMRKRKLQSKISSFDIAKGEKVLILGPSGSGKSTLAQCLNGIIPNINKGQAQGR